MGDGEGESKYTHFLNAPPLSLFSSLSFSFVLSLLFSNCCSTTRFEQMKHHALRLVVKLIYRLISVSGIFFLILQIERERNCEITVKIKIKGILEEVDK